MLKVDNTCSMLATKEAWAIRVFAEAAVLSFAILVIIDLKIKLFLSTRPILCEDQDGREFILVP